jgi:von Willebrand factor type A domain/Aerotolerance regulator N-terminal
MFFLNLTAVEFFTLLGALGGLIAALYLLDRSKRRRIVSTLQFWTPGAAPQMERRRRIREPWSLLLQLASLLLLLLAIAQLEWGTRGRGRNYVLLLDTSAWSAQRQAGSALLEREKQAAERYLAALAPADRIMLVRVDSLTAPVTPFTSDRGQLLRALRQLTPGFSALNLEQALTFARQVQSGSGGEAGEIVYIGPRMISERELGLPRLPNLRAIAVERVREHVGIRGIDVERSESGDNAWQASVTVRNYGIVSAAVRLHTRFAGTAFSPRLVSLDAGAERAILYRFVTDTAGQLTAQLQPDGDRMGDDRITLDLPRIGKLRVAVFTDRPAAFAPLLGANSRLSVRFLGPSEREAARGSTDVDLMILDRLSCPVPPNVASIWINPPREASPLPVKAIVRDAVIRNWRADTPLGEGLHARDARLSSAEVFQTFEGDIVAGEAAEGPIVVARGPSQGRGSIAVIGFDPLAGDARLDVTTPLLFANLFGWISPSVFRRVEISAQPIGLVTAPLEPDELASQIQVFDPRGAPVPFIRGKQDIELFTSAPEVLRLISATRERRLSVTAPDVAPFEWKPPLNAATGPLYRAPFSPSAIDLWRWLAVLGALGLLIEWILFGSQPVFKRRVRTSSTAQPAKHEQDELVAK